MVMTDFPSPSDRPNTAKDAPAALLWALFRPFLFASGLIGLTIGALVMLPRTHEQVATAPPVSAPPASAPTASVTLPEPEPAPPIGAADFQGFRLKPTDAARAQTLGPADQQEAPASDRYELTLRLEKGDTIEKMLADIDIVEADRKQIDDKLRGILKKRKLSVGETITLTIQNVPDQPDAPRVLTLSVRPQPELEFIVTRRDDGSYDADEKTYKVSSRIVRVDGERQGSLQQSGIDRKSTRLNSSHT